MNVKPSADAVAAEAALGLRELLGSEPTLRDFVRGNIKARERMVIQYSIAGQLGLLVVGTDHTAEAVTGFFTKYGDGRADITPLTGVTKRQGAALLEELGAPPSVWEKVPTADLEDDRPPLPDEVAPAWGTPRSTTTWKAPTSRRAWRERWSRSTSRPGTSGPLPVTPLEGWWRR